MFEETNPVESVVFRSESPRQRYMKDLRGDLTSLIHGIDPKGGNPRPIQELQLLPLGTEKEESVAKFCDDRKVEHICGTFFEMFKSVATLGSGCSGVVKKVQCRETKEKFAVKIIRTRDEETTSKIVEEFKRVSRISVKSVIRLHKLYIDEPHGCVYLLMDYFPGRTLAQFADYLTELPDLDFAETCRGVFSQVASAVRQLHLRGIVHRDLAPGNILVSDQGEVRIIDFNVAKFYSLEQVKRYKDKSDRFKYKMLTVTGTPNYRAPEMMQGSIYSEGVDIWSLGCILHKLATGQDPFVGEYLQEVVEAVIHSKPSFEHKRWELLGDRARKLGQQLLEKDPSKRPSAAEVVSCDWLKDLQETDESPTDSSLARELVMSPTELKFGDGGQFEDNEEVQKQLDEFAAQLGLERRDDLTRKASLDDSRLIRKIVSLQQARKSSAITGGFKLEFLK